MGKQEKNQLHLTRPNSSPALSSLSHHPHHPHHPRLRGERREGGGWEGGDRGDGEGRGRGRGKGTMVALAGWPEPVYVAMEDQSQWERRRSRPPSPILSSSAPHPPHPPHAPRAPAEKHRSTRPTTTTTTTSYSSHSHSHREDAAVRSTPRHAAHPTSFSRSRENSPPLPPSSSTDTTPSSNGGDGAPRPPPRSIFAASCPYTTEGRPCPFPNHPDCFAGGHGQARFPVPSLPLPQLPRLPRPLQPPPPPPPRPPTRPSTDHSDQRYDGPDEARGGGSPLRRKTSLPPDFFKAPLSPPPPPPPAPPSASSSSSSSRPTSRTATSPTTSHSPNGSAVYSNTASARRHGSALAMTMTSAKRSGLLVYKPTPIHKSSEGGGAALPRVPRTTDQTMATEVYPRDPDSGFLWGGGKNGELDSGQTEFSSMEVDS